MNEHRGIFATIFSRKKSSASNEGGGGGEHVKYHHHHHPAPKQQHHTHVEWTIPSSSNANAKSANNHHPRPHHRHRPHQVPPPSHHYQETAVEEPELGSDEEAGINDDTIPYRRPSPPNRQSVLLELSRLQQHVEEQQLQLEELHRELEERDAEGEDLRQALNLEKFKYELLVDLWAMRVLDNEELGIIRQQQQQQDTPGDVDGNDPSGSRRSG